MSSYRIITGALCLMAAAPLAKAGPQEDAMLQQVKQMAAQGQNAQTTAQVNQYVDQNKDLITSILQNYVQYMKQIQDMSGDGTAPAQPATPQGAQPTPAAATQQQTQQPQQQAQPEQQAQQNAAPQQATQTSETAQALQPSSLQPSDGLQPAHLAGYPALPAVDPVSAVQHPTTGQLNHASAVQKEMQDRKQYLMEHPEGYTY